MSFKKFEMASRETINDLQNKIDRINQRLQNEDMSLVFSNTYLKLSYFHIHISYFHIFKAF